MAHLGTNDTAYHYVGAMSVPRVYQCEDTIARSKPNDTSFEATVLIIGGGGGGGVAGNGLGGGGGGGAGGYREFTKRYFTGTNYTVTVGAGAAQNTIGTDSSIERIASGGGRGEGSATSSSVGGSGGGSVTNVKRTATSPRCNQPKQGNSGGRGNLSALTGGAGGGGAGADGSSNTGSARAGSAGGNGTASSITGSSVTRGGGGGGGSCSFTDGTVAGGSGGSGGGGAGGTADHSGSAQNGSNGTANTGGGGGGGDATNNSSGSSTYSFGTGGNGGSGFVVIKLPDTHEITIGGGLTSSSSTSGGFTTVQFTAGTDTVSFAEASASLTIAKISDGSDGDRIEVIFSLTTLPAGTTQLKYTISGTGTASTVVTIPTSTANNENHDGTGGSSTFRSRYNSSLNRGSFFHGDGDAISNISLTVEALNSGGTTLATSNTLTGMVIDEDG